VTRKFVGVLCVFQRRSYSAFGGARFLPAASPLSGIAPSNACAPTAVMQADRGQRRQHLLAENHWP
jgi:hypothetical protein